MPTSDPDRLIDRVRASYSLALTAYALANLATTVPYSAMHAGNGVGEIALAAVATLSTLATIPGIVFNRWQAAWPAAL